MPSIKSLQIKTLQLNGTSSHNKLSQKINKSPNETHQCLNDPSESFIEKLIVDTFGKDNIFPTSQKNTSIITTAFNEHSSTPKNYPKKL